jgi:flagellar hook-length control protein FliK
MQIFPASSVMDNPDYAPYATGNGNQGQGAPGLFADLFGQAQARVNSRVDLDQPPSGSKVAEGSSEVARQKNADKRDALTSMAAKNTSIKELKMTREDLADLEDGLKEFGLSTQDIQDLREKVDSGITWGGFLHALSNKMDRPALNIGQESFGMGTKRELTSFFQKLGFTPQKSAKLIQDLERGALLPVWQTVADKLKLMPADTLTGISKGELEALAKAMRMPKETAAKLSGLFTSLSRNELTPDQLKAATAMIKQHVAQAQGEMKEKAADLKQLVAEAIQKAVGRQELSDAADNRETKETAQLRLLIEHEARNAGQKDANAKADMAETQAQTKTQSKAADDFQAQEVAKKAASQNGNESGQVGTVSKESVVKVAAQFGPDQSPKDGNNVMDKFGRTAGEQNQGWAWDRSSGNNANNSQSSMQKDDSRDTSLGLFMSKLNHASNGAVGGQSPAAIEEMLTSHQTEAASKARDLLSQDRIMRQVESGLLRNLGEGKHQLTMRLDPPQLGKLMVILQVQNKEVNAVIRTQNQDVSRMVAEQMSQLRHMLEQQGLKVDKLEVQTQLPNDQSPSQWQGASQHNMAQEKDALSRQRRNWQALHGKGEEVVQEMQTQPTTAKISSNGLDIFA